MKVTEKYRVIWPRPAFSLRHQFFYRLFARGLLSDSSVTNIVRFKQDEVKHCGELNPGAVLIDVRSFFVCLAPIANPLKQPD
jgi:hypothetical protein